MKVYADFNHITGKIKELHGVGQPPITGRPRDPYSDYVQYLTNAGVPYSRLHDVGGLYGGYRYVDIPNIFRDFDADETLPESYDFAFTDELMEVLVEHKVKPFFRLGVTIENYYETKSYRIFPPKDFEKWARICEHVIRHYNEGWADGYHFDVKYWEIWNEPEGYMHGQHGPMWFGTKEEYFRLYEVTANHLKTCFGDSIKIGGYSTCNFADFGAFYDDPKCEGIEKPYKTNAHYHVQYMHDFFKYISSEEHKSPLDYFSWHTYSDIKETLDAADYCRKVMTKYGFGDVQDCLTEWNTDFGRDSKNTSKAAARALAMMLGLQKKTTSIGCYYDARLSASDFAGLFNSETRKPRLAYYAFMMFNHVFKLENEIETSADNESVFVCGAKKENKAVLLVSNIGEEVELEIEALGVDLKEAEVLMISDVYHYTPTGMDITNGKLKLPSGTCVEIRFY